MTRRKTIVAVLWLVTAAWTAVLFGFSGQNAQESADLSMKLTQFVLNIFPNLPCSFDTLHYIIRKCAHFSIFALEGMLLSTSLILSNISAKTAVLLSVPVCAVVAALNEYHQSFAEGRVPTVMDACIDTAGAVTGIALVLLAGHLLRKNNAKGS